MTSESLTRAQTAMDAAADKQANNVVLLDVGEIIAITDYFVVADASNARQVKTIVDEVEARLAKDCGAKPRAREGADASWVLLDYGDVVVHVFLTDARDHFGLDRLWSDAAPRELGEPGDAVASA